MARVSPTPPIIEDNGWYTAADAAFRLGLSRTTFWRYANNGAFCRTISTVDRRWRYRGKEIRQLWYRLVGIHPLKK